MYGIRIDDIAEELAEVKATLTRVVEITEAHPVGNATYSEKLESNMNAIGLQQRKSNVMVKALLNKNKQTPDPDDNPIEKQERTCIVRKPKDPNIKDSRDIRKVMNTKWPLVKMNKVRNTADQIPLVVYDS